MIWNSLQERSVSWLEVAGGRTFALRLPGLRPERGYWALCLKYMGMIQCVMDAIATVARGKLSDGELMAVHFEDLMTRSKLIDSIALGAPARSSGDSCNNKGRSKFTWHVAQRTVAPTRSVAGGGGGGSLGWSIQSLNGNNGSYMDVEIKNSTNGVWCYSWTETLFSTLYICQQYEQKATESCYCVGLNEEETNTIVSVNHVHGRLQKSNLMDEPIRVGDHNASLLDDPFRVVGTTGQTMTSQSESWTQRVNPGRPNQSGGHNASNLDAPIRVADTTGLPWTTQSEGRPQQAKHGRPNQRVGHNGPTMDNPIRVAGWMRPLGEARIL